MAPALALPLPAPKPLPTPARTLCSTPNPPDSGRYLSACFNEYYHSADPARPLPLPGPVRPAAAPFTALRFVDYMFSKSASFRYVERGSMASMGLGRGVVDVSKTGSSAPQMTGFAAFVAWRGAYLSKQLSYQNMILVPMFWFKSFVFGRDISRF